jgi:threonine synthase
VDVSESERSFQVNVTALVCTHCGAEHPLDARLSCDTCLGPVEPAYDYAALRGVMTRERIEAGPRTLWRYIDLLPVTSPPKGGLPVGLSPLVPAPRLAKALGLRELHIKIEAANPTHSFKDRVVSVASAKALELGLEALACASTGNLAGAVAAQAAALGLEAYIFIPADLEREKIIAASVPGAHIFAVEGTYDDANRLVAELAYERPWAFVNFNVRPYYAQGSKTVAFETAEQLGWRLPDQTIAPIASGSLYTKIDRGFRELLEVELVEGEAPIAYGAQAEGCSPVASAFARGVEQVDPVRPDTIAKSLAIGAPADGANALKVARRSGARIESVTDDEIVEAIGLLARTTGYFTETAGGVTIATLAKLARNGEIDPDGSTVAYLTGDGLKTPDAAFEFVAPHHIEADIDAVDEVLARVLDRV